VQITETLVRN